MLKLELVLKIYSVTGSDLDEKNAWFAGLNLKKVLRSCSLGLSHPGILPIITILPSPRPCWGPYCGSAANENLTINC